jgi:hypothetical protein
LGMLEDRVQPPLVSSRRSVRMPRLVGAAGATARWLVSIWPGVIHALPLPNPPVAGIVKYTEVPSAPPYQIRRSVGARRQHRTAMRRRVVFSRTYLLTHENDLGHNALLNGRTW